MLMTALTNSSIAQTMLHKYLGFFFPYLIVIQIYVKFSIRKIQVPNKSTNHHKRNI